MSFVLGLDCKLFIGTAGQKATTEMEDVQDVNLNLGSSEVDVTTRGSKGWKEYIRGLKDASLEFDLLYNSTSGSEYKQLLNSYLNGTAISLLAGESENDGLDADWVIVEFNKSQPRDDASKVSVTAKLTKSTRNPDWIGAS